MSDMSSLPVAGRTSLERSQLGFGFWADEDGRRIYFPPFGPARWIPSLQAEDAFRRGIFRCYAVGFALGVVAQVWFESSEAVGGSDVGISLLILFGVPFVGSFFLARQWSLVKDSSISYRRALLLELVDSSYLNVCWITLANLLAAIGVGALLIWSYWFRPIGLNMVDLSALKLVRHAGSLLLAVCALAMLHRAWWAFTALQLKRRASFPEDDLR